MKKVQTGLRLPPDVVDELKALAEKSGMSFNGYLEKIVTDATRAEGYLPLAERNLPDRMRIKISPEIKENLQKRAEETGLSVIELLSDFVNRRSYANVEVAVSDLYQLLRDVDTLVTNVNGIYTVMKQSGKVYPGEMNTVIGIVNEINEKANAFYEREYKDRQRICKEARKRVFAEVKEHKIKGRVKPSDTRKTKMED